MVLQETSRVKKNGGGVAGILVSLVNPSDTTEIVNFAFGGKKGQHHGAGVRKTTKLNRG